MKTIFIAAYISGIVYQLLCTDIMKKFANASNEVLEETMKKCFVAESKVKPLKLWADFVMFVGMIIVLMLWPIILALRIGVKIRRKYIQILFIRRLKKLEKFLKRILEKAN